MKQKRSLALLLAMSMCASTFAFVACGETAHTKHTLSDWKSDNTNHWKICTECNEKFEEGAHSFSEGVCSVCGKEDPNAQKPNDKDDDEEEELPPLPYDPSTDKETPGLDFTEITDEDGAIIGYSVKPGSRYDRETEELFLPQRHNDRPVLCVGLSLEEYTAATESEMSQEELLAFGRENGFSSSSLKTVHIGPETTMIGPYAFSVCLNIKKIELPERIRSIEAAAFASCSYLEEINFPEGLRSIGYHAFDACQTLKKATLPSTLKTLDDGAFVNNQSLEEVTLSRKLTSIGAYTFYGTSALKTIALTDNIDSIGDYAFASSGLESIDFGDNVQTLGESAFFSCGKLESVEIPDCVTSIGKSCFDQCVNQVTNEDGTTTYASGLKNVKIGSGVSEITERAFENNMLLETVELTEAQIIGEYAFSCCPKLKNFNFGNSLLRIDTCAFYSCTDLEELAFPDTLTNIGKAAFQQCRGLKKVTLGLNLSVIEEIAFDYCYGIEEIIYRGSFTDWGYVQNKGGLKAPTEYLGGN